VAKPELGSKRQCQNCGAKFFDLSRDPILCPKCGTVFQVAANSRPQARVAAAEDEPEPEAATAELVSLEDADTADGKAVAAVGDDIEIEDDETADETFLEEGEEDDDDVAGLIDGDIEDDEES
jgi:uncharacterized protein (TIGR02300 family)